MFLNAEITNKSAELGLTIPFGIDMLQAFTVPGGHGSDQRRSQVRHQQVILPGDFWMSQIKPPSVLAGSGFCCLRVFF
jgi:hypothetical protein